MSKIISFTDLDAWKESHKLSVLVYKTTGLFPQSELFGLTNQIRRASVSVTSNIAEGFGRQTMKEKVQFYYMSKGSLQEIKSQLILAKDLGYFSETSEFKILYDNAETADKILQGLINKTKQLST